MKYKLPLLLTIGIASIIILLILAGISPIEAFSQLIVSSLGSMRAIAGTLRNTTPLLVAGVAVYLALRAGLFNIGVEGQLIVGALAATCIALNVTGFFGVILAIIGGMLAGALWALPAGLIKAYKGGHEVITTIMLNNIAIHFTTAIVVGPMQDKTQEGPTTAFIDASTRLPHLFTLGNGAFYFNLALVFGIILLVLFTFWLKRSVGGYELDAVGTNKTAAEYAGVKVQKTLVKAMFSSGALAGLAGTLQVLAFEGRFFEGFSPGYGFDSLGVALLAGSNPLGILPSALVFGALDKGSASIQLFGVPKGFSHILLGLLIIVFAAYRYRRKPQNG